MAAAVYVVRSTLNPGVPYEVLRAEYEQLLELNILDSLDEVFVPAEEVVITDGQIPTDPAVGTVWFNRAAG